jgi:hypothetical protein
MFIDIQKMAGGTPLPRGKVHIGAVATNPVDSPISVYSDYNYSTPISTPLFLDANGLPVDADGAQVNLYFNADFTIQLTDEYAANFYLTPPTVSV